MIDEAMLRLLAFDRRRYWLENGWSIRFRITLMALSIAKPHGLKYSLTLHDVDGTRLLDFDNAHRVSMRAAYDHQHRFRRDERPSPYDLRTPTS